MHIDILKAVPLTEPWEKTMTTTAEKVIPVVDDKAADKSPDKRRALGRGLESLLPSGPRIVTGVTAPAVPPPAAPPLAQPQADRTAQLEGIVALNLDQIAENPYQTRRDFSDGPLEELAESIKANGVVQPVVVRPGSDGRYILILGERRCRASKLAGKTTVPAIVRRVSDGQAAEMTIVENLQRQDLNCLEQAEAYARLSRDFGLTQEEIGKRVGVSRESVSNYTRLLKLPKPVLHYLGTGELGFSEARVLLQLIDVDLVPRIADEAVQKKLSVKQLEELVTRTNSPARESEQAAPPAVDPNVRAAQMELERSLGVRVQIRDRKGKGKIIIEYSNLEDFDRVLEMLAGSKQ
jgi:ParB family transcriptional regulator, chromosome partitioning protein